MGHSHHHDLEHEHHTHDHGVAVTEDNKSRILWAMLLTFGFMLAELIGGIISGSLALLADAGHMLSDGAALLLSWLAFKISDRQANHTHTFGWHRFQVLAAFVNGLSLLVIAVWIIVEAVQRIVSPVVVMTLPMLVIATLGLIINIIVFKTLSGGDQENLNLKSAMIHVLGDMLGSVAAILAALLIWFFQWYMADPLLSLLVAVLIIRSGWIVVKKSAHILIEGTPNDIDMTTIRDQLIANIPAVIDAHHIHAWSLTNGFNMITLHVSVDEIIKDEDTLRQIKHYLESNFNIQHSTIQLEHMGCPDQSCIE